MRSLLLIVSILFVTGMAWQIGGRLSPDALGMALGVLFGVLAGIPMALMVLASARRRSLQESEDNFQGRNGGPQYRNAPQAPVIILTGAPAQYAGQHQYAATNPHATLDGQFRPVLPGPTETPAPRKYKVVGEKEEWLDDFS